MYVAPKIRIRVRFIKFVLGQNLLLGLLTNRVLLFFSHIMFKSNNTRCT